MHESEKVKVKSLSRVRLLVTPWTTAYQAPPSMGVSRQEYWCRDIMLLLLLQSRFSRIRLCATPEMAAHQAPHPWDSLGKDAGVGCHFLLQCMKVKK